MLESHWLSRNGLRPSCLQWWLLDWLDSGLRSVLGRLQARFESEVLQCCPEVFINLCPHRRALFSLLFCVSTTTFHQPLFPMCTYIFTRVATSNQGHNIFHLFCSISSQLFYFYYILTLSYGMAL